MNGDEDAEVKFDDKDEWYRKELNGEREKKMNVDSSLGNIQSRDPESGNQRAILVIQTNTPARSLPFRLPVSDSCKCECLRNSNGYFL